AGPGSATERTVASFSPASRIIHRRIIKYRLNGERAAHRIGAVGASLGPIVGAAQSPGARLRMLAKRIIPCLDVDPVRGVKRTTFGSLGAGGDPVDGSAGYAAEGADELVFLDIPASHEDRAILLDVVRRTAEVCFMPLTVGGGIRSVEDVRTLLKAGADKV